MKKNHGLFLVMMKIKMSIICEIIFTLLSLMDFAYSIQSSHVLIKDFDFGAMLPEESNAMGIMQLL